MRETFRDIHLPAVLFRQDIPEPLSVGGTVLPEVDRHVEHLSADHSYKFPLRMGDLKMEPPQHSLHGHALVVLNEPHIEAGFPHVSLIICFHEISAFIAVHGRFYDIQTFNRRLCYFNLSHSCHSRPE